VLKEEYEATAIASFRSWPSERKEGILYFKQEMQQKFTCF